MLLFGYVSLLGYFVPFLSQQYAKIGLRELLFLAKKFFKIMITIKLVK